MHLYISPLSLLPRFLNTGLCQYSWRTGTKRTVHFASVWCIAAPGHVSRLSDEFIRDIFGYIKKGQHVKARVMDILKYAPAHYSLERLRAIGYTHLPTSAPQTMLNAECYCTVPFPRAPCITYAPCLVHSAAASLA